MSNPRTVLEADVLIVGGGLAGTWAAVAAARQGARVVLADKGYCGTSGITAASGPGHWWVPPDPERRANAVEQRYRLSEGLGEREWMARIIDCTWRTLPTLAGYYDFSSDDHGVIQYRALRGPEYLNAMRRLVEDNGVRILDQSPALELLLHRDGSVAGAAGYRRQAKEDWTVRAGAVVLATGGCAFKSRLLGCHTNTGDGHLMAVEAGAELSGMEFSNYYTVAPAWSSMTRSMSYAFAAYRDGDGNEIAVPQGAEATRVLARALLAGPVFCRLDRMPEDIRARLRRVSPNVMLPFDRKGVDPFTDWFPVALRGEGTVRGSGGVRIVDEDCQTGVRGLFAVGDAATRELVTGGVSGGGNVNSAWAVSSGQFAGRRAAVLAKSAGRRVAEPALSVGEAGLRPGGHPAPVDDRTVVAAVQAQVLAYDRNIFRTARGLGRSLDALNGLWSEVGTHLAGTPSDPVKARETAAMVATGRWCFAAALARNESRGMHRREDAPGADSRFARRLRVGGLDRLWTSFEGAERALEVTP